MQCNDPDLDLYLKDVNMKQAQVIDAESIIVKWETKNCKLGKNEHTSAANVNNSGTLEVLANLAITNKVFTDTYNEDKDYNDGEEQNFAISPSIDQINNVVDDIHREDG